MKMKHTYAPHTLLTFTLAALSVACTADRVGEPTHDRAPAKHAAAPDIDIADALAAIDDLEVVEVPEEAPPGYRFFRLSYGQPVDHDQPDGARFRQHMALLHRSADAPMIFNPQGYDLFAPHIDEPTALVAGNQLSVEHRYFGASRPDVLDWQYLTIEQSAADHHRIVNAIKPLYTGAWVSTGVSKGGMTATYHRRFYPDDVDATIAYVAPLTFGMRDPRYALFLHQVGSADCRQRQRDFQREALERRASLVPTIELLAAQFGTGFTRVGGGDVAYDIAVAEYLFQFWQYGATQNCQFIPSVTDPDDAYLNALAPTLFYGTDLGVDTYLSYYYQSATQLGSPLIPTAHIDDLLVSDPNDYSVYLGDVSIPGFDWSAMFDIAFWSLLSSESMMFVYGEIDPWTAGPYPLPPGGARDTHAFTAPDGNHGVGIAELSPTDRDDALAILENWTGVTPALAGVSAFKNSPAPREREPQRWITPIPPRR